MRFRLAAIFLLFGSLAFSQMVPTTTVETLSGKKVELPDAVRGEVAIFLVGFSRDSSKQVSEWNKNVRVAFGGDPKIQIYQAADIAGAPRLFRGMITAGIRKGQPPDQRDNFFVVTEDDSAWKQWAGFSAPDDAYIVLANKSGQQVWKAHGAFNQASLAELKQRVVALEAQ